MPGSSNKILSPTRVKALEALERRDSESAESDFGLRPALLLETAKYGSHLEARFGQEESRLQAFQSLVAKPLQPEPVLSLWRRWGSWLREGYRRWQSSPAPFLLMGFGGLLADPTSLRGYNSGDRRLPVSLQDGETQVLDKNNFPENLQLHDWHAELQRDGNRYLLRARDLLSPVYTLEGSRWRRVYPLETLPLENGRVVAVGMPPVRAGRNGFDPSRTTVLRWEQREGTAEGAWVQVANDGDSAELQGDNAIVSEVREFLREKSYVLAALAEKLGWSEPQWKAFLRGLAASPVFLEPGRERNEDSYRFVVMRFKALMSAMQDGAMAQELSLAWAQFFAGGVLEADASSMSYLGIVLNGMGRLRIPAEVAMSFIDALGADRRVFDKTSVFQLDTFGYLLGHEIPSKIAWELLKKYQAIVKDNHGDVYLYLGPTFIALRAGGYRPEQAADLLVYLAEKAHWSEAEMAERALWMSERMEGENDEESSEWLASVHRELRSRYGLQRILKQVEWIQQILHQGFVTEVTQTRLFETVAEVLGKDACDGFHAVIQVLSAVAPGAKDLESQVQRMIADFAKLISN